MTDAGRQFAARLGAARARLAQDGPAFLLGESQDLLVFARDAWGGDDPRVGHAEGFVGRVLDGLARDMPGMDTSHHDEPALAHLQEAEAILQRTGGHQVDTGVVSVLKAAVLRRMGRPPLAQRDARLALSALPNGHADAARARAVLGGALVDAKQFADAEAVLRPLQDGDAPLRTWSEAMLDLATALREMDRADQGALILRDRVVRWSDVDRDHPEVHHALEALEKFHTARRDWAALISVMEERRSFYTRVHGSENTATADLLADLAHVYERAGDGPHAASLRAEADLMMKRLLGDDARSPGSGNPTASTSTGLGVLYVVVLILFTVGVVVAAAAFFAWLDG